MLHMIGLFLASFFRLFRSRRSLWLENLALRQQLVVFKRKHPRPRLAAFDKLFWVLARKYWPRWKQALIVVSLETIPRWHRAGFQIGTQAPSTSSSRVRQTLLGPRSKVLASMETSLDRRKSGDHSPLAPCRLSSLLGLALAPSGLLWRKTHQQGTARIDLPHGGGEPNVGSAPHSRRTANAWLRCLGAHDFTLGPAGAKEPRQDCSVEGISQKSPRSHCRDGLFHSPHRRLRTPLLLLPHWS